MFHFNLNGDLEWLSLIKNYERSRKVGIEAFCCIFGYFEYDLLEMLKMLKSFNKNLSAKNQSIGLLLQ